MSSITARNEVKELAYRAMNGLEVALLWYESTRSVSVAVSDSRSGEAFELVLGNNDNALDVFHHPYAYAASKRLDFDIRTQRIPAPAPRAG